MPEKITDPKAYFFSKGGLHDSDVIEVHWSACRATLEVHVGDLNASFEGLPEYPGCMPAVISFLRVNQLNIQIGNNGNRPIHVGHIQFDKVLDDSSFAVKFLFWPEGIIEFNCTEVIVDEARRNG